MEELPYIIPKCYYCKKESMYNMNLIWITLQSGVLGLTNVCDCCNNNLIKK